MDTTTGLRAHKDELRAAATALLEAVTEEELRDAAERVATIRASWLAARPMHGSAGIRSQRHGGRYIGTCHCGFTTPPLQTVTDVHHALERHAGVTA